MISTTWDENGNHGHTNDSGRGKIITSSLLPNIAFACMRSTESMAKLGTGNKANDAVDMKSLAGMSLVGIFTIEKYKIGRL